MVNAINRGAVSIIGILDINVTDISATGRIDSPAVAVVVVASHTKRQQITILPSKSKGAGDSLDRVVGKSESVGAGNSFS